MVLGVSGWMLIESRIQVLSDQENVYIHGLPGDRDSDVHYRIDDKTYGIALWDPNGYYVTVPLGKERRPLRGVVPIDLEYRTWAGLPRTKRINFDLDEEQIRLLHMSFGSGGAAYGFQFEDSRVHIRTDNERCVRWTYALNGEEIQHEIPEHAEYIEVGDATTVRLKTNLCHRIRQCTILMKRGDSYPSVDYGCF